MAARTVTHFYPSPAAAVRSGRAQLGWNQLLAPPALLLLLLDSVPVILKLTFTFTKLFAQILDFSTNWSFGQFNHMITALKDF